MSESTVVYRPEFFFISDLNKFSIQRSMTVGRSETDLIINDKKLSSRHCKLNLSGLLVSVIDLGSTNGTFVNGEKLPANEERKLQIGDRLRIGSYEYVLKEHDDVINTPKVNEGKESYHFRFVMLFNFFEANVFMRVVYGLILVMGVYFAYHVLKVPSLLPSELNFLIDLAASNQIRAVILTFVILYGANLFHAYASRVHLKNSLILKILFFLMLTSLQLLTLFIICFSYDMDLGTYEKLHREISKKSGTSISQDTRIKFEKSYNTMMKELSREQQILLTKDYQNILSKMGSEKGTSLIKNK